MRILIIDDELVSRKKLQKIMENFTECEAVESGEDGLKIIMSDNPPDLILLDIMMPEMNGYEVFEKVKADPQTKDIPVIFLSGLDEKEDIIRGLEMGAVDYISKPFHRAEVKARVLTHLSLKEKSERKYRESEEKYRTILEDIEDGYFEIDLTGNLVFFNDAICRITGYSKDELTGINNRKYMDKETAKRVYKSFAHIYQTGEPIKGLECTIQERGNPKHVEVSASLLKDRKGQPIGC